MIDQILRKEAYNRRRRRRLAYRRKIAKQLQRHIWILRLLSFNEPNPSVDEGRVPDDKCAHFKTKPVKDCFRELKNEMKFSKFVRSSCNVCLKLCTFDDLKKLELEVHNLHDFHNLSATIHQQKLGSNHFPSQYSTIHRQHYHIHGLTRRHGREFLECCEYCSRHLAKGKSIPKFSIPNYFFPEPVPECLQKLSVAELLMVSRVFPRCIIYTLSKNSQANHRFLKGEADTFH